LNQNEILDPLRLKPKTGKAFELSIIIVHYNTPKLTMECIRSIYAFPPRASFEVILIDNGSDENIEEKIREEFPEVLFLEMGKNVGFARANNLGIFNSHGKYVLLLNSDTKIIEPLFDCLTEELNANRKVGCIGPLHLDGKGRYQLSFGRFPTLRSEFVRKIIHRRISINDPIIRDYLGDLCANPSQTDWISGSCLMLRREMLYQTGLLDESFFMYFEDVDLCTRIRNHGWEVRYSPLAKLIHYGGESVKGNLLQGLVEYRRSQLYFTKKYYGWFGSYVIRLPLPTTSGTGFLNWALQYFIAKSFKKETQRHYVMLLLSKKVIEMMFSPTGLHPAEPALRPLREKVPS